MVHDLNIMSWPSVPLWACTPSLFCTYHTPLHQQQSEAMLPVYNAPSIQTKLETMPQDQAAIE